MEKNIDCDDDFHKIKVFSSEDEKLKSLGELLSNKSSRDIIRLLIDKEMYINEIAKKLDMRVSLIIHHLQKMESIGLLEITNKKIAQKGEEHRFFRIPHGMLIFPEKSEYETNNGLLKKIFKKSVKFMVIGMVAFSYWFLENSNKGSLDSDRSQLVSLIVPLLIIIIGLLTERLLTKKVIQKKLRKL
ncbi:MAG: winged helix-turn-helix domain-containing protein [Nitrosarchaeum sp.]|nr:winged helix-turn-helix domain-containing protein [Nitrosarchaeum sp.]